MTDASDEGVAGCLFVVRKADARDVTMEDLQNHNMATLISINSKILDDGAAQLEYVRDRATGPSAHGGKTWVIHHHCYCEIPN